MTTLPATDLPDEGTMVDIVAHWLDLVAELLTTENSRRYMQATLKRLMRQGTLDTARVITWANSGWADADIALRELCGEMWDCGETPPASLNGYGVVALKQPQVGRRKGGDDVDNWLRDQCIAIVVSVAFERWHPHLKLTRNSASKKPSICSIVSKGLNRRRINIGEKRVGNIYTQYADFLPAHQAWQVSLPFPSNAGL
jgi:hypothetical protein